MYPIKNELLLSQIELNSLYDAPYCVVDNCLCLKKENTRGTYTKKLCNFVPFVLNELRVDESDYLPYAFTITGIMETGEMLPIIQVRTTEFSSLKWIWNNWGVGCIFEVGSNIRSHVRCAIQSTIDKHIGDKLCNKESKALT